MRGAVVEHGKALRTELCRCIVAVVAEGSTQDCQIWSSHLEDLPMPNSDLHAGQRRQMFSLAMFCYGSASTRRHDQQGPTMAEQQPVAQVDFKHILSRDSRLRGYGAALEPTE